MRRILRWRRPWPWRDRRAGAFNSSGGDVERVPAMASGRHEQSHQDEQGNDAVGNRTQWRSRRTWQAACPRLPIPSSQIPGERQEHQRHADMHAGLDQERRSPAWSRADHHVAHSGNLPLPERPNELPAVKQDVLNRAHCPADDHRQHKRPDRNLDDFQACPDNSRPGTSP